MKNINLKRWLLSICFSLLLLTVVMPMSSAVYFPEGFEYWSDGEVDGSYDCDWGEHTYNYPDGYICLENSVYTSTFFEYLEFQYKKQKFTGNITSFSIYVNNGDEDEIENFTLSVNGEDFGKPDQAIDTVGQTWLFNKSVYDEYALFELDIEPDSDLYDVEFCLFEYDAYCGYNHQRIHTLDNNYGNGYIDGYVVLPLRNATIGYSFTVDQQSYGLNWDFGCYYDDLGNDFPQNNTFDITVWCEPNIPVGRWALGNDNDEIVAEGKIDLSSGAAHVSGVYIGVLEGIGDYNFTVVDEVDYFAHQLATSGDINDYDIYDGSNYYEFKVVGSEVGVNYSVRPEFGHLYVGDEQTIYASASSGEDFRIKVFDAGNNEIWNSSLVTGKGIQNEVIVGSYIIPEYTSALSMYHHIRLYDNSDNLISGNGTTSQYLVLRSGITGVELDVWPDELWLYDSQGNVNEINIDGHHDFVGEEVTVVIYRIDDITNVYTYIKSIDLTGMYSFGQENIKFKPDIAGNYSFQLYKSGQRYGDLECVVWVRDGSTDDTFGFYQTEDVAYAIAGLVIIGFFVCIPVIVQVKSRAKVEPIVYGIFATMGICLDIVIGLLPFWVIFAVLFIAFLFVITKVYSKTMG